jgi:hypothetical protein
MVTSRCAPLADASLSSLYHMLGLARQTHEGLRQLPPDDVRDEHLARVVAVIHDHEAELARRTALTADVVARSR